MTVFLPTILNVKWYIGDGLSCLANYLMIIEIGIIFALVNACPIVETGLFDSYTKGKTFIRTRIITYLI